MSKTLGLYLREMETKHGIDPRLTGLVAHLADTCKEISFKVSRGALAGVLGSAGSENVQGETQKKLDVIANDIMCQACAESGYVSGIASEEMDHALQVPENCEVGPYLVLFDPLDGSSNIDINVSIGTIFSILPAGTPHRDVTDEEFLQPGVNQLAAGYVIYGPQTQLVFTMGHGTVVFTLDLSSGTYLQTCEGMNIPAAAKEFAINCSNMRHWEAPVVRYINELLAGKTGPRGKDFNMRWVAAMVAEVHRILNRGGIFMYPRDNRDPSKPGKLRLMYEANPMSWLIEEAGGVATNGYERIREIKPEGLHQRVAVFLGAKEEVELVTSYHQ
ncbi:MAG: class 1 fructose-bisphosphatase [Burkholderiaceae bacterium]|nr:class 1 fructose-bisphosphatase [Burkholderiaceae bacterium]MBR5458919.1 class 1 fructose-bisphosphatase [Burkholderiaceae bacterium]